MDISFSVNNSKGDLVKIALSNYDLASLSQFTSNKHTLSLTFYDVTLIRESGYDYVGYDVLSKVSETLARFLQENHKAVLCFYCDAYTGIRKSHEEISPQEYRSLLFTRMFERYCKTRDLNDFLNYRVRMEVDKNLLNSQFAHFICRKEHEYLIDEIRDVLMTSDK